MTEPKIDVRMKFTNPRRKSPETAGLDSENDEIQKDSVMDTNKSDLEIIEEQSLEKVNQDNSANETTEDHLPDVDIFDEFDEFDVEDLDDAEKNTFDTDAGTTNLFSHDSSGIDESLRQKWAREDEIHRKFLVDYVIEDDPIENSFEGGGSFEDEIRAAHSDFPDMSFEMFKKYEKEINEALRDENTKNILKDNPEFVTRIHGTDLPITHKDINDTFRFKEITEGFVIGNKIGLMMFRRAMIGERMRMDVASPAEIELAEELRIKINALMVEGVDKVGGFPMLLGDFAGEKFAGLERIIWTASIAGLIGGHIGDLFGPKGTGLGLVVGISAGGIFEIALIEKQKGAGQLYLDLIEDGIDPQVADEIAAGWGLGEGLFSIITGPNFFTAPLKQSARKLMSERVKEEMVKDVKEQTLKSMTETFLKSVVDGTRVGVGKDVLRILVRDMAKQFDPKEMKSQFATAEGRNKFREEVFASVKKHFTTSAFFGVTGVGKSYLNKVRLADKANELLTRFNGLVKLAKTAKSDKRDMETFIALNQDTLKNQSLDKSTISIQNFNTIVASFKGDRDAVAKELGIVGQLRGSNARGIFQVDTIKLILFAADNNKLGSIFIRNMEIKSEGGRMTPSDAKSFLIEHDKKVRKFSDRIVDEMLSLQK